MMKSASISVLRSVLKGSVYVPGDAGYDRMRATWNLAIEHRPALVVVPEEPADVIAAVRFARTHGLSVAAQGSGHGPVSGCEGGVLINNVRMKRTTIDPSARTARVQAGALWSDLLEAAHPYGLAGLSATSTATGVAGFTLGGGTGWLAREYGYASDSLIAAEVVTGDGRLRRATERENADLFWALRGGGGSFGVVTALELRLHPVSTVYGGSLYFPIERAFRVFERYLSWTRNLPRTVTSALVIHHVPDAPSAPPALRGKSFVMVQGCLNTGEAAAVEMLRPLRALGPVLDDFKLMPYRDSGQIADMPADPVWVRTGTESLSDLPLELVDDILMEAGDRRHTSLSVVALRHVEGAFAGLPEGASAASRPAARFVMVSSGSAFAPERQHIVAEDTAALRYVCRPYRTGTPLFNFVGWGGRQRAEIGELFSEAKYRALARIKDRYDPENLFRFAMPVACPELAAA